MHFKRLRTAALSLAAAASVLLAGCSTPAVALTVGDKTYEMGDYLAYAYNTLYTDTTAYMYLYYYGEKALDQKVQYGEGDAAQEIPLDEYVRLTAVDTMIRQKALEDLLAEYGVAWDAELVKKAEEDVKELKPDAFLPFGFTNERYIAAYKAIALNESSLFKGLYDKGGQREVPEADIRKFFDENYRSFFSLDVSLINEDKSEKTEAEVAEIKKQLETALAAFNASGKTVEDFQEAYRAYLAATEKKDDAEDDKTDETDKEEEKPTLTRQDLVKKDTGVDEDLLKAVDAVAEGTAGIQTYQKGGTQKTMSLIFRLDPEAERDKDVDYYEDNRQRTLQYLKYEEFDKEVSERADKLAADAVRNKRALKAVDLAEMIAQ